MSGNKNRDDKSHKEEKGEEAVVQKITSGDTDLDVELIEILSHLKEVIIHITAHILLLLQETEEIMTTTI